MAHTTTGGKVAPNPKISHVSGGQGAKRIAVGPTGKPWIINGSNQVMERSSTADTGTWQLRGQTTDCATDIGVGGTGNGEVWIIGCGAEPFSIFRWNGMAWVQPNPGSFGRRITVDANGVPWLVTSSGQIWRRPLSVGSWQFVADGAVDIGAGPGSFSGINGALIGYVYITSTDDSIWAWDEQPQAGDGFSPARFEFVPSSSGRARTIAVGPDAVPWVIASDGTLWTQ